MCFHITVRSTINWERKDKVLVNHEDLIYLARRVDAADLTGTALSK